MLLLLAPRDVETIRHCNALKRMADVGCCRDREAVGEDGGELPEHEGEAAPTRGRPCLPRRHLLQIQELSQTLPGASSKVAQHGCCLEEERGG